MAETGEQIRHYYIHTAKGPYDRWGAGVGGYHFTFYDEPPNFTDVQPEEVALEHYRSHLRMLEVVTDFMEVKPGQVIIDAGCGEGSMFLPIEAHGASVIGVNIVRPHLLKAKDRIEDNGLKRSQLVEADFNHFPLPDAAADKVLFFESLTHSVDQERTLTEAKRLLRDNGQIIIAEPMLVERRSQLLKHTREKVERLNSGMVLQVNSVVDLRDIFKELNLEIVKFEDITENVLPSMQLAAASAEAHSGDAQVPADLKKHRLATIAFRDLVEQNSMRYLLITIEKAR